MRTTTKTMALAVCLALGCGPVGYEGEREAEAGACAETVGGEQGTPDELSELMAELIAPRICEQVTGSFIGLPGDETHEGTEAGLDPAVGRWWIRRCHAEVLDGRLRVAIGGPGWTWLDRESTGFRVRQYLRFESEATFSASLHVGYDGRTRIASIWLRPAPGVRAHVEPTGLVNAEATGVFASMLGGLLDLTGSNASDRARAQAAEEGSQRLTERLATGFTVTFHIDTEQMDFMLGELSRGQVPQRPWPGGTSAWIVNERSGVWPGGMDVLGPIPPDAGVVALDVELEQGDGAVLRRVCEDDLHRWLDNAWNGHQQGPPDGDQVADLRATRTPTSALLPQAECRSLLVVSPRSQSSLPIQLRYRVAPVDPNAGASAAVAAAGGGGTGLSVGVGGVGVGLGRSAGGGGSGATGTVSRGVRVQLRGLTVRAENATGGDWDMFGGEPDPYVVVASIAQGREIFRTEAADDTREVRIDGWIPGALRMDQFPIRFVVYDEDVAGDEVVGSADLEASAVGDGPTDIALDLRSQGGSTPAVTGVIRLRLQPVD